MRLLMLMSYPSLETNKFLAIVLCQHHVNLYKSTMTATARKMAKVRFLDLDRDVLAFG
jgi:hypothetical protein